MHTLGSHRVYIHGIYNNYIIFLTGVKMTEQQSKHVAYLIALFNKVVVLKYII